MSEQEPDRRRRRHTGDKSEVAIIERSWVRSTLLLSTPVLALVLAGCTSPAVEVPAPAAAAPVTARSVAQPAGQPAAPCPAALTAAPIGSKTVSIVVIDWIDVVEFGGRQYVHGLSAGPATIPADKVGPALGRIRCRIADSNVGTHYVLRDGDATFLPVGTELHAILGVPVTVAVAVGHSGRLLYYKVV